VPRAALFGLVVLSALLVGCESGSSRGPQNDAPIGMVASPGDLNPPVGRIDAPGFTSVPTGATHELRNVPIQVHLAWGGENAGRGLLFRAVLGSGAEAKTTDPVVSDDEPGGAGDAVRLLGRAKPTQHTRTNTFAVDLPAVPDDIGQIVFLVSVDGIHAKTLAEIGGMQIVLTTDAAGLLSYHLPQVQGANAALAIELYRGAGGWVINPVGRGSTNGWQELLRRG
jgi:hypothetical protein